MPHNLLETETEIERKSCQTDKGIAYTCVQPLVYKPCYQSFSAALSVNYLRQANRLGTKENDFILLYFLKCLLRPRVVYAICCCFLHFRLASFWPYARRI